MNRITFLSTFFILFLLCSCTHMGSKNKIEEIDLRNTLKNYKKNNHKINLSLISSKIEYIPLETESTNLISTLSQPNNQIKFFGGNVFINRGKILRFNLNGKFINAIGSIGKGPNEYISSESFTPYISKKDTLVAIYSSSQHKLLKYNLQGKYINQLSVNFWPIGLTFLNSNFIFINYFGRRKPSNYYTLSVVSENSGKLKKRLLFKKEEINKDLMMFAMNNSYKFRDTLSYWEKGYDTIWRITNDFKTIPKYYINIGDNKLPIQSHTREIISDFKKYSKFNKIQLVFEATNFYFFIVTFNKRIYSICYDKKIKKSYIVEFKNNFEKKIHASYFNDIDGGIPFWPMGKVDDNKMFMVTYGYEIKDYIAKKGKHFDAIDKQSRENLLKLVEKSKISDNPILMVVTLKK